MVETPDAIAIERVNNLISGFGWSIVKQEVLTDKVVLTIEKKRQASEESEAGVPG